MQRIPTVPPEILPVPPNIRRPLWSVMIPAYNCSIFLREAIRSVLKQDLGEDLMQIEVIDDHSTDADIEKIVREVGKGRVQYFRQSQNVGSLRNFETCINRSKGKFLHLLHGDDCVLEGFYDKIASLFDRFPGAGAAFTNFSYIDEHSSKLPMTNNKLLDESGIIPDFLYKIAKRQLIQPPAIVVKREVYEKNGSFFAAHFGEDWEMWSRIASQYPVAYSPERLAMYRVSNTTSISHNSFTTGQNITDILKIIDIIQQYIPVERRKEVKDFALAYYSIYCVKVANSLLLHNRKAAFIQARGAFKMHKNLRTFYWVCRFYLMHLFRYKQLEHLTDKIKTRFVSPVTHDKH
jgi:glycosyltransferase involved in cell wall biosynthesis